MKFLLTFSFHLYLFLCSATSLVAQKSAKVAFEAGNTYFRDGQYQKALNYYSQAIRLDSSLLEARIQRATIFNLEKKWILAVGDLDHVLSKTPQRQTALLLRGEAKHNLGLYKGAISDFNQVILQDSLHVMAFYARGKVKLANNLYKKALSDFQKTLLLLSKTKDTTVHQVTEELLINTSECYKQIKMYEKSLKYADLAIEQFSKSTQVYYQRASVLYAMSQWKKAIEDYTKAIKLQPKHINAYYYRAMSYQMTNQYKRAISDFNSIIKLDKTLLSAYVSRGFTYFGMGKYKEAVKDYTLVLRINKKDAATYIRRGYAYTELHQFDKAITDFNEAMKVNRYYTSYALNNRGNVERLKKNFDAALEDINKSIAADKTNAWAYLNRALVYADQQKLLEALEEMNIALSFNPDLIDIYYHRAAIYQEQKEYAKALNDYATIELMNPFYKTKLVAKQKKVANQALQRK